MKIEIVKGEKGFSLLINDYHIAGPIQRGDRKVIKTWEFDEKLFLEDVKKI